jgi:hypothetical protein
MYLNSFYDLWDGNKSLGIPMYSASDAKAMARKYQAYTPQKVTFRPIDKSVKALRALLCEHSTQWLVLADITGKMVTVPTQDVEVLIDSLEHHPDAVLYWSVYYKDLD